MLGLSPYVTRSELLHQKATGIGREFSDWFQEKVLDNGHAVEALARPFAEEFIGSELYPVSAKDGRLWVSTDGMTMDESFIWECKQWNRATAESIENEILPEHHQPQCQQALMITKAKRLLFTVSDGTMENTRFLWVYPDQVWFKRLRDGWAQFEADLVSYVPPKSAPPKSIGKVMDSLPALRVLVHGEVTDTNVDGWAEIARAVLGSINRTLNTDQDFADAANAIKWCADQEAALDAAKQHALSQTESIDKLFKTIDAIREETRSIRLEQTKLLDRRKIERKTELVSETAAAWHAFTVELNDGLVPYRLPAIATDFPAQIKNKRNFESMKDALDTELARAKIEVTDVSNKMRTNVRKLDTQAAEFKFLFNDSAALILRDAETLELIIGKRIADHKESVAKAEADRVEKIRAEEQAKAEAAAHVRAAEILKAERDAQAARDREAQAEEARLAEERRRQDEAARQEREKAEADLRKLSNPEPREPTPAERQAETVASVGSDVLAESRSQAVTHLQAAHTEQPQAEHAWINIGKMNEAFGFTVTADFIVNTLGIQWSRTEKAAKFWTPTQFEAIKRKVSAIALGATPLPF